jgi:hypothetical protein
VSSESIVSATAPASATERCARCDAPLAGDQRYCLECGERRLPPSSVLLNGPPASTAGVAAAAPAPQPPPQDTPPRNGAVTLIAGVGVLLLAMGVGVLIGRSGGSSKPTGAATPQVISVSTTASGTGAGAGGSETATFTDDWPAGTNGYTVQLQALPQAGTQIGAVEAAKAAAATKGAKDVGALKSEDFSSLTAGSYIVYSGVFHRKPEAAKALAALKKSFPAAKVVTVSSAAGSKTGPGSGTTGAGAGAGAGAGSSPSNPAPPKVLEELHKTKGKSYEEKSKNLPNVVGT